MSVTTKFASEEPIMAYYPSKKPESNKKTDFKNYRKPDELAQVIL